MSNTYLIYKPYGMLSQFTREHPEHLTLADLDYNFEPDVYPVGRLDRDSEGLLILSSDKTLNQKLLHPDSKRSKEYWVQVEGQVSIEAIEQLRSGVSFRIKGKQYRSAPCQANIMEEPEISPRTPPIRFRKSIPTSWLSLTIQEGKNRQVRRMCAAAGFPVLRLLRWRISTVTLSGMKPGDIVSLEQNELSGL